MTQPRPTRPFSRLPLVLAAGLSVSLGSLALGQIDGPKDYAGYAVVQVTAENAAEVESAMALSETIWSERSGIGPFEVVASAEQLAALTQAGLEPVVVINDLGPMIAAESAQLAVLAQAKNPWFDSYHRTVDIHSYLDGLVAAHPQLATLDDLGDSLQGRELKAIRITGPGDSSNRPIIFYNGGQHAREWISPATVTYIADQLLTQYGTDPLVTALVDQVEWVLLPVTNPDGYEYSWDSVRLWRKNRRDNGDGTFGVDLNRNWDIDFGGEGASANTNSETYHGPFAFSEPETAALRDFIASEPRMAGHIDWHCFSQLILYPWGYSGAPPLPADLLAFYENLSGEMSSVIQSQFGTFYTPQPSIDLYPAAGVMGDYTADQGLLAWTIELRPATSGQGGFVLPPEQILETGIENFEAVKVMASAIAFPFRITPDAGNPAYVDPNTATDVSFSIVPQSGVTLDGSPTLLVRTGTGAFTPLVMTNAGGDTWTAALPATAACETIEYSVAASADDGRSQAFPFNASAAPLSAEVLTLGSLLTDDMETDTGWTVGSPDDDATTGIWSRSDPEGTAAQPEDDASPAGTMAWITDGRAGTGVGSFDIDGGQTTLTSPLFDATDTGSATAQGPVTAILSYQRWYSNDQGNTPNADSMLVEISNDDGQNWSLLEEVSENLNRWELKTFNVADVLEPTAEMRVRFIASDFGGGSIVEAGVDDLRVEVRACTSRLGDIADDFGTLGGDGMVSFGDFLALLGLIGPCPGGVPGCTGDIADDFGTLNGGDGMVSFGDFLALLGLIG